MGRKILNELYQILLRSEDKHTAWRSFSKLAMSDYNSATPVAEFSLLLSTINSSLESYDADDVCILNHGSGSGVPELYWIANGYRSIKSVDIYSEERHALYKTLNSILLNLGLIEEDVFYIYDGKHLPFRDNQFNIVNSTAVVEHLSDEYYGSYFAEQRRVLKNGGCAVYLIPQRLQPYDSHNRTWFVHWLPYSLHERLNRIFGRFNADLTLVLRTKYTHIHQISRVLGSCSDLSVSYFLNTKIKSEDMYDGRKSRGLAFRLCQRPLLRTFLPSLLSPFIMAVLLGKKER